TALDRRHQRRDVRGLSRCAWNPPRQRREIAGVSNEGGSNLRELSREPGPHEGLHTPERFAITDKSADGLPEERALPCAHQRERSFRADVQRLSRQPWRGAARRRNRRERVWHLSRRVRAEVRYQRSQADLRK